MKMENEHLAAHYDAEQDILYLTFTSQAREAIAEEAGDEVFVRFEPDTWQLVDIEFLNFSARLRQLRDQDNRAAYGRSQVLNRAWLRQRRGRGQ